MGEKGERIMNEEEGGRGEEERREEGSESIEQDEE